MTQEVVGVFDSTREAKEEIRRLQERGYEEYLFTFIAKSQDVLDFEGEEQFDYTVITTQEKEDESFFDRAMRFFMDVDDHLDDHLENNGVPEEHTPKYMEEIEKGKIVVMIRNDEKK
ncbi:general stress protein [Peribacillus sp. SCS-37]|uniref:general stress protein n=1 Tax=Paraperibacillus esterisolvens TaxID=3115296 RepID=UPI003905AA88